VEGSRETLEPALFGVCSVSSGNMGKGEEDVKRRKG
jgi:hypothetical protein